MAFTPQFLDELRNRLSIGAVVGRRVRLQRRGKELTGLCPFHNEKTPSFTVSEDKGFFHCFGCGAHGDVVGFVMQSEGLGFPEAVEKLAAEAGLPVPRDTPEERHRAERQQSLHTVLEAAAAWFAEQLAGPAGRGARDYLHGRGLEPATIARFRLGFAPDGRRGLLTALTKAGLAEALLVEAGLVIRPEDGDASDSQRGRDRFRGRVMFPITDRAGRVIAFGGRILGDGEPKYLNSPETPLFHKGRTLYNLAEATRAARDSGEVVVVEGYMDAIALAQAGLAHVVAPLGTALTEEQIELLWRLAPEPVLCFDGDAAGQRAAARALDRALPLLRPGLSLRFALLPAGEDPDSLVRAAGQAAIREVLAQAQPLAAMLWQIETAGRDFATPERRAGFRQHIREKIRAIADRTVQDDYRAEIEQRLDAAFPRAAPGRRGARPKAGPGAPTSGAVSDGQAARRGTHATTRFQFETMVATLLNHPALISEFAEPLAHVEFPPGPLRRLRDRILDYDGAGLALDSQALRSHLCGLGLAAELDEVLARTRGQLFTRPQAGIEKARDGLSHALGMARGADARRERDLAAVALGQDPTEATLERFHAAFQATLDGEAQRRDLDGGEPADSREPAKGPAA